MYLHSELLINEIAVDEPDPAAANALQEGLGGQFGEMRTMMQYLFQSINFRGDKASKPYKDLLQGVGTEEISHVELIGTTIARLLDGSPEYQGKKSDSVDKPGAAGATPLKIALDTGNIHHYLVGAQVRYRWTPGTFAMWDNRCTQHFVVNDFEGERIIQRVAVLGDDPVGDAPRWDPYRPVHKGTASRDDAIMLRDIARLATEDS